MTSKEAKINFIAMFILAGMFVYLLFSFLLTHYLNTQYPYNTFLCSKLDAFMDFFNVNYFVRDLNPYSKNVSYPPFALLVAYPFSLIASYRYGAPAERATLNGQFSFFLLIAFFSVVVFWSTFRTIKGQGTIRDLINTLAIIISYPVLFVLDRGNYLMLTFIFLHIFILYYNDRRLISLIALSAAIAMKIYPGLFLLLLFSDKRYKDSVKVILITAILSILPLFLFKIPMIISIEHFVHNLVSFSQGYANPVQSMSWNASLMGLIKIPVMLFNHGKVPFDLNKTYLVLAIVILLLVAVSTYTEKRFWKKVLMLTSAQILLPSSSSDYNLVYLLIPLLLLLTSDSEEDCKVYLVTLGLLFIPKTYLILYTDFIWNVSIQSFLNPLLLLFLLCYYFVLRYKEKLLKYKQQSVRRY